MRFLFSQPPLDGIRPAIFLDRDGVINERVFGGYVRNWSEFRLLSGACGTLARLAGLPYPIVVLSNQAGVGKGLIEPAALADLTERFVLLVAECGGRIDAVYYCPHLATQGCGCRKPAPGLFFQAAREWRLSLPDSVMIGDSPSDIQAAEAAGCQAILVGDGLTRVSDRDTLFAITAAKLNSRPPDAVHSMPRAGPD